MDDRKDVIQYKAICLSMRIVLVKRCRSPCTPDQLQYQHRPVQSQLVSTLYTGHVLGPVRVTERFPNVMVPLVPASPASCVMSHPESVI